MSKLKVYYAHSMHLYGKPQEKRDIELLEVMGFEVINPSDSIYQAQVESVQAWCKEGGLSKESTSERVMELFKDIVLSADVTAFRAHPDGKIPSGVGKEIKWAMEAGKPIIELPSILHSRFLEIGETRKYLEYLGER